MAAKGQVRKRGRSWQVDVSVNGERVRRSVGASKVEARRILEQLHEMPAPRGYAALGDILDSYLGSLRLRGKSRTIHQAGLHAARLEAFYGVTFNAIAVTAADIDAFVRQRRTENVSPETINGALRVLRAALRLAADPGGPLEGRVPPRVKLLRVTDPLDPGG